jgi:hypothetical protein
LDLGEVPVAVVVDLAAGVAARGGVAGLAAGAAVPADETSVL